MKTSARTVVAWYGPRKKSRARDDSPRCGRFGFGCLILSFSVGFSFFFFASCFFSLFLFFLRINPRSNLTKFRV